MPISSFYPSPNTLVPIDEHGDGESDNSLPARKHIGQRVFLPLMKSFCVGKSAVQIREKPAIFVDAEGSAFGVPAGPEVIFEGIFDALKARRHESANTRQSRLTPSEEEEIGEGADG